MAVATVNQRALRNEAAWLPETLEDAVAVRRAIMDAGYARAHADGVVGWLVGKAAGEPDTTGQAVRSRYRKLLATLESPLQKEGTMQSYGTAA